VRVGDSWTIDYSKPAEWMKPLVRGVETDLTRSGWYLDDLPPMMFIKKAPNYGFVNRGTWRKSGAISSTGCTGNGLPFTLTIHPDVSAARRCCGCSSARSSTSVIPAWVTFDDIATIRPAQPRKKNGHGSSHRRRASGSRTPQQSWRNRDPSGPHRDDGLLTPAESPVRNGVSQARRAALLHGSQGHIVLASIQRMGSDVSYIEEPEAAACKVSIAEQPQEPRSAAVFDPDLPIPNRIPLAICDGSHHTVMRTSLVAVSHGWALGMGVLAIVGAAHGRWCSHLQRGIPLEEVRSGAARRTLDHFVKEQRPKYDGFALNATTTLKSRSRRRRW
jgi:hypothetical protein